MADKSIQLILSALSQAVAYAEGLPLFTSKTNPGLFPNNATGKQAAQRCLEDGHLRNQNPGYATEPCPPPANAGGSHAAKKTKTPPETYVLTEKGFTFLFQQVSPRQALEDLVPALEQRQGVVNELLQSVRQMQTGLDNLRTNVGKVLQTLQAGPGDNASSGLANLFRSFRREGEPGASATGAAKPLPPQSVDAAAILEAVRSQLTRWQTTSGASEDCPLPELFRQVQSRVPRLSIGQFHDVLRKLYDQGQVYLHPWTGPLYDLPEPPQSLLVGHEVAYYASLRSETTTTADASRSTVAVRS